MKKTLLVVCFFLFTIHSFGQQFSQYNTGTLYDSFENPSVRSFIPDSSRMYAFNFLLPNLNTNFYITGNAQVPLKSRAFLGYHIPVNLTENLGRYNRVNANANYYSIMFKMFTNLEGTSEIGISAQTRVEGRGLFTDESVLLYNGANAFKENHYDDIFNNQGTFQAYHQISFSYRERINRQFAVGVKLSALLGIQYQKADVLESHLDLNKAEDYGVLSMRGKYRLNYVPGEFNTHDYLPTFRNPGAAITVGTSVRTRDDFNLQLNVKDLGFIHWSSRSYSYNFNATDTIFALSSNRREKRIYDAAKNITHTNNTPGSFVTPTNSKIELSANKDFWINPEDRLKYSPTLILSKELFFPGFTAALVNPIYYKNYVFSLSTAFDNYQVLSVGGQFMIKSPNAEFFIGSERLVPLGRTLLASTENAKQVNYQGAYAGADITLGVTFKFGPVIEHPMNASYIPLEDKPGFFRRIYNRLFHKIDD